MNFNKKKIIMGLLSLTAASSMALPAFADTNTRPLPHMDGKAGHRIEMKKEMTDEDLTKIAEKKGISVDELKKEMETRKTEMEAKKAEMDKKRDEKLAEVASKKGISVDELKKQIDEKMQQIEKLHEEIRSLMDEN